MAGEWSLKSQPSPLPDAGCGRCRFGLAPLEVLHRISPEYVVSPGEQCQCRLVWGWGGSAGPRWVPAGLSTPACPGLSWVLLLVIAAPFHLNAGLDSGKSGSCLPRVPRLAVCCEPSLWDLLGERVPCPAKDLSPSATSFPAGSSFPDVTQTCMGRC